MCRAPKRSKLCQELRPRIQGRAHSNRPRRRVAPVVLSPGRIHRSLPRQAYSQHRPHRQGVQAALRRRRLLERRCRRGNSCSGSTPPRSSTRKSSTPISTQLEEAKRRDHRVLGKQLELFTINPIVGSGLILWLPKGAIIRQTLEEYIKGELRRRGYQAVYTPNIGKVELYQISGHFPYYNDSQFPPIKMEDGERVPAQADELPAPHHDLQVEAAQLSRPAGAAGRVRHRLSLRAIGRAQRHDPRPRLHSGRCPPLLHRRASGRRIPRLPRNDSRPCSPRSA